MSVGYKKAFWFLKSFLVSIMVLVFDDLQLIFSGNQREKLGVLQGLLLIGVENLLGLNLFCVSNLWFLCFHLRSYLKVYELALYAASLLALPKISQLIQRGVVFYKQNQIVIDLFERVQ